MVLTALSHGTRRYSFMITLSQSIQIGAGDINVAAVVIAVIGLDVFTQMIQVSLLTAVFA